jgi:mitochondrial fission protein ELM1
MVNAMFESETRHLEAFLKYVQKAGLADELVRKDYTGFALGYNGPGYWQNDYDGKIARAVAKYSRSK